MNCAWRAAWQDPSRSGALKPYALHEDLAVASDRATDAAGLVPRSVALSLLQFLAYQALWPLLGSN